MANLIADLSPKDLSAEIRRICRYPIDRELTKAELFLTIATLQKYSGIPQNGKTTHELNALVAGGALEINRGIAPSGGTSALHYAKQLLYGDFFPGTQTALGHGIYWAAATRTCPHAKFSAKYSETAAKYAVPAVMAGGNGGTPSGIILRAVLAPKAKILEKEDVMEYYREFKNRAKQVGITDLGTFCAAIGYDGICAHRVHNWSQEICWNIVNRSILICQSTALAWRGQKP